MAMTQLGTFAEYAVLAEESVIKIDESIPVRGRLAGVVRGDDRLGVRNRRRRNRNPAIPSSLSAPAASESTPCRAPALRAPTRWSRWILLSSNGIRQSSSAPRTRVRPWRRPWPVVQEITNGVMADRVVLTPSVLYA